MAHTKTKGKPQALDVYIGEKLRERRLQIGMSQITLAVALGLTFQQIQKYERGTNRISASRLFDAAEIMETPLLWFFPKNGIEEDAEEFEKKNGRISKMKDALKDIQEAAKKAAKI